MQLLYYILLYILDFNITFITVKVISREVVLWAEESSTYCWSRFNTVKCGPHTSEAGVRFPARPQVGKLVVACRWSAIYSTEP